MRGSAISPTVDHFVLRWQHGEGGQERANYALFLTELCDLIDVPRPDPAGATHERNDYVFERVVTHQKDDGTALGRIDLYKKNSFVLEAKQSRLKGGSKEAPGQPDAAASHHPRVNRSTDRAWDVLMLNAKRQAEQYARALPTSHGWPPFILVCDVGRCIEVYADFSGQGKNYTQFPDRRSYRIGLEDLHDADVRARLTAIWLDPQSLDPAQVAAKVTRSIAKRLAQVSLALEKQKHPPEEVAMFLMRCLFTMFAEDVGLLPQKSFKIVLEDCEKNPKTFVPLVTQLWEAMDTGTFAHVLKADVRKFNGAFFKNRQALPLGREEIGELRQAASHSWREVDPSIFGTLLEQALDTVERKRLGAHYTPRAYVERLVVATVIEPLREDWRNVVATADHFRQQADALARRDRKAADIAFKTARQVVRDFHETLCATRILDPACGTGNFLYVALEQMKKLEGEVLELLETLGGQESIEWMDTHNVDPHQFLGLEINPRAAAIAELVLWIGYLQWHFRTKANPPHDPILRDFKTIQVKNAVLTWDGAPPIERIKGKETLPNPRRPEWPVAEFIVGNPPFIGKGAFLRAALGDTQTEALWIAHPRINPSADFVMYWWDKAAELLNQKGTVLRRFGFVTTNSITQLFNRKLIERHLKAAKPVSIVFAIADHPWTKVTSDAASVRIAMTVAEAGKCSGISETVIHEGGLETDTPNVVLERTHGAINSDLSIGSDVTGTTPLRAQQGLSSNGMMLAGSGFLITAAQAKHLGLGKRDGLKNHIRDYRNGRDLMATPRQLKLIDLYGLSVNDVRTRFPEIYQHLLTNVKPERDRNRDEGFRNKWWIFGRPRVELRPALKGLKRYVATVETTKHRVFQFLDIKVLPDHMVVAIASDDAFHLGVLASRIHSKVWMPANAASLGVYIGDVRYTKSRCFDPFPFPAANNIQKHSIRVIADDLDAHRKRVLTEHPHLTMTGIYNVLEDLRAGAKPDNMDDKHRHIFDDGLVLILKELHERLDAVVSDAYGWPADLTDAQILTRLVALNAARADEERRGEIRWLRPDYQIPRFGKGLDKQAVAEDGAQIVADLVADTVQKRGFPHRAVEQTAAVFAALSQASGPLDAKSLAMQFRRTRTTQARIAEVLASLARLGYVTSDDGRSFALRRVA